jgi:hypothetical protein
MRARDNKAIAAHFRRKQAIGQKAIAIWLKMAHSNNSCVQADLDAALRRFALALISNLKESDAKSIAASRPD